MPHERRARLALLVLALLALGAILAFMTLGARGNWGFVLPFRGKKLLGLLLVGHAVACSTVLFQTVTANRILTPAIMGFDSLFVLCSTVLVALFGSTMVAGLDPRLVFAGNVLLMVGASMALYLWLFGGEERSLHRLLLIGVVFGIFLRMLAEFVQRMLDPNEFMVLSDMLFASFGTIPATLLGIASAMVAGVTLWLMPRLSRLDVIALGRPVAVNLGIRWRAEVLAVLAAVSVLVAVSAALVGPVLFFGLIAASLAHLAVGQSAHRYLLPAASLIGVTMLVGGQTVLERVFAFNTALGIIVEFAGGITFIALLIGKGRR
ncbi:MULTISPECIES: iron chelate uptake ABC transporter family permease subunit [Paracoccus]|uniref:iron chelate uptake ABC transporter family permease subunit n=1 Tax=Paracoccus TaxID=265 RepID=UPI000CEBA5AD|nr:MULTISPECIES: iron chelate uptake ABC transporter family permease subunit [Paracoccus]UFS63885.1 iron chelate uptake ABC transporter family permease subunit [Paracoccus denitrificans]